MRYRDEDDLNDLADYLAEREMEREHDTTPRARRTPYVAYRSDERFTTLEDSAPNFDS